MAATGGVNVINLDVFDDIGSGADLGNLNVKLTMSGKDNDGANDDTLDFDPNDGTSDILQSYLLDAEVPDALGDADYLAWGRFVPWNGHDNGVDSDVDSVVEVAFGDSAPTYFIQALRQIRLTGNSGLPTGTCFGTANCL